MLTADELLQLLLITVLVVAVGSPVACYLAKITEERPYRYRSINKKARIPWH